MKAVETNWQTLEGILGEAVSSRLGFINPVRLRQSLSQGKNGDAPHLVGMMKAIALELWLWDVIQRGLVRDPYQGAHSRHEPSVADQIVQTGRVAHIN